MAYQLDSRKGNVEFDYDSLRIKSPTSFSGSVDLGNDSSSFGGLIPQFTGTLNQGPNVSPVTVYQFMIQPNACFAFEFLLLGNVVATDVGGQPIGSVSYEKHFGTIQNSGGNNVFATDGFISSYYGGLVGTGVTYSNVGINFMDFQVFNSNTIETMQWRWYLTLYSQ